MKVEDTAHHIVKKKTNVLVHMYCTENLHTPEDFRV